LVFPALQQQQENVKTKGGEYKAAGKRNPKRKPKAKSF
jgi:hypothetical protein